MRAPLTREAIDRASRLLDIKVGCVLAAPSSLLIHCKTAARPFSLFAGGASALELVSSLPEGEAVLD